MSGLHMKALAHHKKELKEKEASRKNDEREKRQFVKREAPDFYSFCVDRIEESAKNGHFTVNIPAPGYCPALRPPRHYLVALCKEVAKRLTKHYAREKKFSSDATDSYKFMDEPPFLDAFW